jgi:hypothetical protein
MSPETEDRIVAMLSFIAAADIVLLAAIALLLALKLFELWSRK